MFAHVTFPISSFRSFTYKIPNSLKNIIKLGSCVNAPINRRIQTGFVSKIIEKTNYKGKILSIDSIHDEELHIPKELWTTLEWISKYYITPLGKVIKAAIPHSFIKPYKPKKEKFVIITQKGLNIIPSTLNNKPAQKKILSTLCSLDEPIKITLLEQHVSTPHVICNKLEQLGLVKTLTQPKITDPFEIMRPGNYHSIKLTMDQKKVVKNIDNAIGFHPYLLHGVTGSGKTEVYLNLAQKIVENKQSVLVLVPEIALTPQVAIRFRKAFGSRVALWHSKMTKAEKGWTWQQLKKGKYSVVVGARSAIFTPLKNLGLIIIDEEQESSYKQENLAPRYHARDVAIIRAKHAKAKVLLTSATPSLESYYNALQNKFTLLTLNKRYGQSNYPSVELIDMKKEFSNDNTIISHALIQAIDEKLQNSEQVIIFQNRRGYSRVQQCMDCGEIKKCSNCSVSLIFHKTDHQLHCHYCQFSEVPKLNCNYCQQTNMTFSGSGTQKVSEILQQHFPKAKILRMDMDTVQTKGAHFKILSQIESGQANILVGTQMIAKGLDFANVTLVGVINADTGLFFPDFRAGERVFQLIYQVAGRAGRRQKPGRAIIQTYNPNDIYIQTAAALNIKKFYNVSLAQRQELCYPPFSRIGRILFIGKNKLIIDKVSKKIGTQLNGDEKYIILGPSTAPLEKIKGKWRTHLIIKSNKNNLVSLHEFIYNKIGFSIFQKTWKGIQIVIDIDPISML